ncbi:glycosyltransferase family 4 protein [Kaistella sp.]|uniref:glycosyltransferase family 4 protein n=1 Tax=Kaistella sp. TaxID=2782235 RepID=UPI0035A1CFDE
MKLLYCIPSLSESGGTERIVTEKINFLTNVPNYSITIVTTEGRHKTPFYKLDSRVNVIELDLNFNDNFSDNLVKKVLYTKIKLVKYAFYLRKVISSNNIDICISTGGKELEFLSSLRTKCIKICEFHFSKNSRKLFINSNKKAKFWNTIANIRTKQLVDQTKFLDRLVILTKRDEELWMKTNNNITQIYNFSPLEQTETFSSLLNSKVIAIGRLEDQKGFDYLIDAWKIVSKKNNGWTLEIYGKGSLELDLRDKINADNLQNSVSLKGVTTDVRDKLQNSSIYALTSRYEGFPMVLLESISCGVPIVSFDCETGPSEIIESNDCGIIVEDKNVAKFASALVEMIENTEMRIEKGKSAREKSKKFSKEIIMNQWLTLFDDLYNKGK